MNKADRIKAIEGIIKEHGVKVNGNYALEPISVIAIAIEGSIGVDKKEMSKLLIDVFGLKNGIGHTNPKKFDDAISTNDEVIKIGGKGWIIIKKHIKD